ncbi:MAG: DegT/DnrJ/EryC1/StrS family aminotransferase [Verrucomicrobiae bacterium]|nr:DegT/DnrJ/EryC1/StrS family aminotransferase [Verrucomicrobiae bacterium]
MSRYQIPLFELNFGREEEDAVARTLQSKWVSTGPRVAELEQKFASMLDAKHAVAVTNCTAALHLAMRLLGIGPGDEVILPSLTFVATANAVRYVGATPVFCDIAGDDNLNMDPAAAASLVTPRTKAILVMHYGGFPCDMDAIMALARQHGLKVVEDACHGPLSEYRGRKLGAIGDIGCFSFFSNKNICTGEGGMLVTNDESHADRARLLRSHGMTTLSYERARGHATAYDVVDLGYNYRLDDIRASIGLVQLGRLRADLEQRARVRRRYLERLAGAARVIVPFARHTGFVSNYIFPIILRDADAEMRDRVRAALKDDGVQTSVHYPAVHRFAIYKGAGAVLPKTERAADTLITLPMFAALDADRVDYIVERLLTHVS